MNCSTCNHYYNNGQLKQCLAGMMEVSIVGMANVQVTYPECPRYEGIEPVDYEIEVKLDKRSKAYKESIK